MPVNYSFLAVNYSCARWRIPGNGGLTAALRPATCFPPLSSRPRHHRHYTPRTMFGALASPPTLQHRIGVLWSRTARSLVAQATLRRGHVHDQAPVEALECQKRSEERTVAASHVKDWLQGTGRTSRHAERNDIMDGQISLQRIVIMREAGGCDGDQAGAPDSAAPSADAALTSAITHCNRAWDRSTRRPIVRVSYLLDDTGRDAPGGR